jgi:hypothetical protein
MLDADDPFDWDKVPDVEYSQASLRQDMSRLSTAWQKCQTIRQRDGIYEFLQATYDVLNVWFVEGQAEHRARVALRDVDYRAMPRDDPYAIILRCVTNADRRTRSKWSRILRYIHRYKADDESLAAFVRRKGGINECAARYARLRRQTKSRRQFLPSNGGTKGAKGRSNRHL